MTEEQENRIASQINNLIRKANQTRDFHSALALKAELWQKRISTFVVVGSAILTLTTFAHFTPLSEALGLPKDAFPFCVGLLSAIIFISQQLSQHKNWTQNARDHRVSANLWGVWLRRADEFVKSTLPDIDSLGIAKEQSNKLNHDYRQVMHDSIDIPDNIFLELKACHREKVWISKELDKDTGETVRQIRKRFRNQCKGK